MIRINLLPVKQAKKRGVGQQQLILFAIILIGIGLLLYSVNQSEEATVTQLQDRQKDIKAEMDRLEELIGDINVIQKKKEDLRKKLSVIDLLRKGKTGPVRILDELSTIIPKKVWLVSLAEGTNRLMMKGFATDNKEIAVFMKNLEASPFFSDVTLQTIIQAPDREYAIPVMSFSLNCVYHLPKS